MSSLICDACGRSGGQTRVCDHVICRTCWEDRWECPICNDNVAGEEP